MLCLILLFVKFKLLSLYDLLTIGINAWLIARVKKEGSNNIGNT